MEELLNLKELLLKGNIPEALIVVEELEEMSRNDIIKTIRSYAVILLLHLIKQQAENRSTRSSHILHQATEVAATQTKPAYAGSKPLILR